MAAMRDRIAARITALQAHQRELQVRAMRDIADVQKEMEVLTKALALLTPESETVLSQIVKLGLLPKE